MCIYECENLLQIPINQITQTYLQLFPVSSQWSSIYTGLIEANTGKYGARFTVNFNLRKTKLSGCEAHSYLIIQAVK